MVRRPLWIGTALFMLTQSAIPITGVIASSCPRKLPRVSEFPVLIQGIPIPTQME